MQLKNIIKTALFTAIIAVCTLVSIKMPTGVSLTLQTFAIALAGFFLGWRYSAFAVLAYILLGVIGVPVFSNFQAGPQVLFGLTGGFIFGFIPFAMLSGIRFKSRILRIVFSFIGLMICHVLGVAQFAVLYKITFWKSFIMVSVPYLIKDFASVVLAYLIAFAVEKRCPQVMVGIKTEDNNVTPNTAA